MRHLARSGVCKVAHFSHQKVSGRTRSKHLESAKDRLRCMFYRAWTLARSGFRTVAVQIILLLGGGLELFTRNRHSSWPRTRLRGVHGCDCWQPKRSSARRGIFPFLGRSKGLLLVPRAPVLQSILLLGSRRTSLLSDARTYSTSPRRPFFPALSTRATYISETSLHASVINQKYAAAHYLSEPAT